MGTIMPQMDVFEPMGRVEMAAGTGQESVVGGVDALVLVGHGSVKSASGASMIRIAARLREQQRVPYAEAGFLNYSRPTLAEALAKTVDQGARRIVIQPYFLIAGQYVLEALPRKLDQIRAEQMWPPDVQVTVADAFAAHPAMVRLALKRIRATDPLLGRSQEATALLFLAHGTPLAEANAPVYAVAQQVETMSNYARVDVSFLDCNQPEIGEAIDMLVQAGIRRIVAMPYFLQFGRHVREDLPAILAHKRRQHPGLELLRTHHLDYDLLLTDVVADRVEAATRAEPVPAVAAAVALPL